jgi:hypothetical protein
MSEDISPQEGAVVKKKNKPRGRAFPKGNVMGKKRESEPPEPGQAEPESSLEDVPQLLQPELDSPPPTQPTPPASEATTPPSKRWRCNVCGNMFEDMKKLSGHMWGAHKRAYRGGGYTPEGAVLELPKPIVIEGGFVVDGRRSPDIYNQMRIILDQNGILDARESIMDDFVYQDPTDIKNLSIRLAQFGLPPNKINIIINSWKRYMQSVGMMTQTDEAEKPKKPTIDPLKATPADMSGWGIAEWMQYGMEIRRQKQAMEMQERMMKQVFGDSDEGMSMLGLGSPRSTGGRVPPEVQAQLDELKQYKERDKLKEVMDPLWKEIRALRGDMADTMENKNQPKKDSMADLVEMFKMKTMLSSLGTPEGNESAEKLRIAMEERVEKKRMEMQQEMNKLQLAMEQAKEEKHSLELKNLQTEMGAKIDTMKTLNEIANKDKAQDLEEVIAKAQRIQNMMKTLGGDTETDDDKKMKMIMGTLQGTVETLKGPIGDLAKGFMIGQQAKAQSVGMGGGQAPQGQYPSAPPGQRPPPRGTAKRTMATCPNPNCKADFEVDMNRPQAECPGCHSVYNIGGQQQDQGAPMGDANAKRRTLMGMDRSALEDVARGDGIDPDQYPSQDSLVDAMLGNSYN